jgi:hypothetical protein
MREGRMGRKIVSTGRGGAGKTTFAALATRYLSGPLLLVDIDSDQSLADMLGIDLEKEGVRTVLDILFDIQKKQGYEELGSMPLPEKIEYLLGAPQQKGNIGSRRPVSDTRPFYEITEKHTKNTKAC